MLNNFDLFKNNLVASNRQNDPSYAAAKRDLESRATSLVNELAAEQNKPPILHKISSLWNYVASGFKKSYCKSTKDLLLETFDKEHKQKVIKKQIEHIKYIDYNYNSNTSYVARHAAFFFPEAVKQSNDRACKTVEKLALDLSKWSFVKKSMSAFLNFVLSGECVSSAHIALRSLDKPRMQDLIHSLDYDVTCLIVAEKTGKRSPVWSKIPIEMVSDDSSTISYARIQFSTQVTSILDDLEKHGDKFLNLPKEDRTAFISQLKTLEKRLQQADTPPLLSTTEVDPKYLVQKEASLESFAKVQPIPETQISSHLILYKICEIGRSKENPPNPETFAQVQEALDTFRKHAVSVLQWMEAHPNLNTEEKELVAKYFYNMQALIANNLRVF